MKSRFAFGPTLRISRSVSLAALGLALLLAAACTGQGEGQRCQLNAVDLASGTGTSDCADGLECIAAAAIILPGGGNSNADICCPHDRTTAVEDICKLASVTPGSDASIPDTGTKDTGTDTGTTDGATDASGDAATDGGDAASGDAASGDAADDGG